ncbi:unnamed protein product, partial [Rotaria sp. Silwood1]
MKFDTTANSAYAYNEWIKQKVQFVNGGQEWNCTNSTTRKAIVIMMKLIPSTFKLTKNQIIVNTTNDTNITPLVCFDDLRINMTTGQEIPKPANAVRNTSNMTTTTTTLPVTTPSATTMTTTIPIMTQTTSLNLTTTRMRSNQTLRASCSIFSSIDSSTLTLVRQPSVDATYQLGTTFYLSWTLNSDFDTSISLEIKLKRSGLLGIPTDIYTWYVTAGRYFFSVTISSLPISTRESYYFSFYWINVYRCVSIPHWKTTNSFRIPTAPYITVYGGYRSTYFPGDTIHVQWMVTNGAFPSGAQVLLRFNRYRWLISDDTVASVWVNPSNYYYDYTIPINLPKEDNDDEYYFRLDWYSSSWISITDTYTSDSNHFYVPTKPIIVPLLPATDDSYTVTDTVKITWTARNFDSTSSNYLTITLKRYRLLLWDETIYTVASCSNPQSELCFDGQLSQVQPSVSDFYYHFSWCGWWPFSCYKNGFYFLIPVHVTDGWNYNPALGKAISQKTIYHADCSSKPTGVVGKLCNESRKMSIDLTCANCYLSYDYSILRLDLIASGGVLGNMNIKFKSTATALRRTITYVSLSILPYVMPSNTDPNVRELADRLLANELNPSSVLYTDTIWAKKLVNSLTQQSNNITGIITTTTTTTTTTPGLTAPTLNLLCPTLPLISDSTILLASLVNSSAFNYTFFQYIFYAISNRTTLAFGFRQDPSYWCMDDVSVTPYGASSNLIINGRFETGSLSPFATCAPLGFYASGTISRSYPRTGNYSYYDGTTGRGDYLFQTFITVPQNYYTISFWLQNLGSIPNQFNATVGPTSTMNGPTTVTPYTTQRPFNAT